MIRLRAFSRMVPRPDQAAGRPGLQRGDAAHDAVILSVQDLTTAQEAVALARQDQEEDERHGMGQGAGTRDSPDAGTGHTSPGMGTPPPAPPSSPPAGPPAAGLPPADHPPAQRPATPHPVAPGPGRGSAVPPRRQASRPPSWGKVLVTTVRLWVQRHGHLRWPEQARWRVLTVAVLAAVLFGAGAIRHRAGRRPGPRRALRRRCPGRDRAGPCPRGHPRPPRRPGRPRPGGSPRRYPPARSCPATRRCAPRCRPTDSPRRGSSPWARSNSAPLGSDLIVSTAAVRSQFGARLASVYAPAVLASFGTGSAQTAIRVVAPDGTAAYLRGLRADVAARASAGRQLLQNPRLHPSAAARRALAAGQVDSRLLTAFAALATMHRVDVVDFPRARRRGQPGHAAAGRGHRAGRARDPAAAQLDGLAGQLPARPAGPVPARGHHRRPAGQRPAGAARRVRRAQPSRTAREGLTDQNRPSTLVINTG